MKKDRVMMMPAWCYSLLALYLNALVTEILNTVTVQLSGNLNCCEEGAKQFIRTHYFYWQSQKEYNCVKEKKVKCKVLFLHQRKYVVLPVFRFFMCLLTLIKQDNQYSTMFCKITCFWSCSHISYEKLH